MSVKLVKALFKLATRRSRMKKISYLIEQGLPVQMEPVLNYLVSGSADTQSAAVSKKAENRRKEIASHGNEKVPIWYSPKPGNTTNDSDIVSRPQPGKVLEFTMEQIAKTGKSKKWGTALFLIAREFEPLTGVELGSCAGISAMYLSSVPGIKQLITIEGSEALAKIAQSSLRTFSNVKVVNALFDDAIDQELPTMESRLDFAYIDGHHEKIATIHYFDRLKPFLNFGSVVIFDDISWSHDMREAWNILSKRVEFAHAIDLGEVGVCVMKSGLDSAVVKPVYWDLQPIVGRHSIGEPHGWKK